MAQNNRYPALRGRIFLTGGAGRFTAHLEPMGALGEALPFFTRRQEWPTEDPQPDTDFTFVPENESWAERTDTILQEFAWQQYRGVRPMLDFNEDDARMDPGAGWEHHGGLAHDVLFGLLPYRRPMSSGREFDQDHLRMLTSIWSYGIQDDVTWLDDPFGLSTPTPGNTPVFPQVNLPGNVQIAAGSLNINFRDQDPDTAIWSRIRYRRFVIVPVHIQPRHWTMTIFDRREGHLYILNTAGAARREHCEAIAQLWAQFLMRMGLPYNFQYFSPETTAQPFGWECGLLGIMWLIRTLREQRGDYMEANDRANAQNLILRPQVGTYNDEFYSYEMSSLPLTDWVPLDPNDTQERNLYEVIHMFNELLSNELGIQNVPMQALQLRIPAEYLATMTSDGQQDLELLIQPQLENSGARQLPSGEPVAGSDGAALSLSALFHIPQVDASFPMHIGPGALTFVFPHNNQSMIDLPDDDEAEEMEVDDYDAATDAQTRSDISSAIAPTAEDYARLAQAGIGPVRHFRSPPPPEPAPFYDGPPAHEVFGTAYGPNIAYAAPGTYQYPSDTGSPNPAGVTNDPVPGATGPQGQNLAFVTNSRQQTATERLAQRSERNQVTSRSRSASPRS